MAMTADDDILMRRLERLVATVRSGAPQERRLLLSLQSDLQSLRAVLQDRSNDLARQLKTAGTQSRAATAYSRTASIGRASPHAKQRSMIRE